MRLNASSAHEQFEIDFKTNRNRLMNDASTGNAGSSSKPNIFRTSNLFEPFLNRFQTFFLNEQTIRIARTLSLGFRRLPCVRLPPNHQLCVFFPLNHQNLILPDRINSFECWTSNTMRSLNRISLTTFFNAGFPHNSDVPRLTERPQ